MSSLFSSYSVEGSVTRAPGPAKTEWLNQYGSEVGLIRILFCVINMHVCKCKYTYLLNLKELY